MVFMVLEASLPLVLCSAHACHVCSSNALHADLAVGLAHEIDHFRGGEVFVAAGRDQPLPLRRVADVRPVIHSLAVLVIHFPAQLVHLAMDEKD